MKNLIGKVHEYHIR